MMVKRFGENNEEKWYETPSEKKLCTEEEINTLWCNWIASGNAKRADTEEFTIFEFVEPIEIELLTAERW